MYVALETRQKATNAPMALHTTSPWPSTPPAAGAANTSRFFTHWRGRAARSSAAASGGGGAGWASEGRSSTGALALIDPPKCVRRYGRAKCGGGRADSYGG